jgi:hypothetical protein
MAYVRTGSCGMAYVRTGSCGMAYVRTGSCGMGYVRTVSVLLLFRCALLALAHKYFNTKAHDTHTPPAKISFKLYNFPPIFVMI